MFGLVSFLVHALTLMLLDQTGAGVAYLLWGLGVGFLVKRSFDRGLFRHGDHLDPRLV